MAGVSPPHIEAERPPARDVHRLNCVYALEAQKSSLADLPGVSIAARFSDSRYPDDRYRSHYERVAWAMPEIISFRLHSTAENLGGGPGVSLQACSSVLVRTSSELLAVLTLDLVADDLRSLIGVLDVTCWRREAIRLDGRHLLEAVRPEPQSSDQEDLRFGADVHQVLMVAADDRSLRRSQESPVDDDLLQRLVTRSDVGGRLGSDALWLPSDLNRDGMVGAVKSGVSVLSGHSLPFNTAATISAVQLLSSLQSLRRIRTTAYDALRSVEHVHGNLDVQQYALTLAARSIERVELELSFAVEAQLNMRLLIPEHAVEHFHRALGDALGFPTGLPATDRMIARLKTVLAARRDSVDALHRDAEAQRQSNWNLVGVVAIPLTVLFGFFGINAREVNPESSLFDLSTYRVWWAVFTVFMIGVIALLVWRSRQVRSTKPAAELAKSPVGAIEEATGGWRTRAAHASPWALPRLPDRSS